MASDVHSSLKKVDAELCLYVGSGASKVFYGLISKVFLVYTPQTVILKVVLCVGINARLDVVSKLVLRRVCYIDPILESLYCFRPFGVC
jgi:hypothetical protein